MACQKEWTILFWGMRGIFSIPPLEKLLQSRHWVQAVMVPGGNDAQETVQLLQPAPADSAAPLEVPLIPSFVEQSIVQKAWQAELPVYQVPMCQGQEAKSRQLITLVRRLQPDICVVACFNQIFPQELLDLPRHGFLNIHPSWLPFYRGPEPLFWQLRDGVQAVGVTVHWMDASPDTGDIGAQTRIDLPDGLDGVSAERRCAACGADLLLSVLDDLARGQVQRHPQPDSGSYQPAPGAGDFELSLEWGARRAYNFMRGTAHWGVPYPIVVGEQRLLLEAAVTWRRAPSAPALIHRRGDIVEIGFDRDVLVARLHQHQ